jgi:transcriptional regulator with XRE-family HTH domain
MKPAFQIEAFCAALDATRLSKMMTWKQVADASGVSASTLTRMTKEGKRPDVDGLAALLSWSGLKAEMFLGTDQQNQPEPLAAMTALLRADRNLGDSGKKALEAVLKTTYEQFKMV